MKKFSFFQCWQAYLFPDFCQNCQQLGPMVCESCYQLIEFFWQEDLGPLFAKNFSETYFDQVRVMANFKNPLSSLIKSLKYHHHSRAAKFLAQMLYFHVNINYEKFDLITFVPIHHQKMKKRGYNQSQLIAQELSLWSQLDCLNLLEKVKNTGAQAQAISKKERLERLSDSFKIKSIYQDNLQNKKILLIDDVITTGATVNNISCVLKKNGASLVSVLTLAANF